MTFDDFECAFGKFDEVGTKVWEDIIVNATGNQDGLLSMGQFHKIMN